MLWNAAINGCCDCLFTTPGCAVMQVATHSSSGARERYFDDDDSFSLQTMVIHIICLAIL